MNGIRESLKSEFVQSVTAPTGTKKELIKRVRRDFYVYVWLDPRKPGNFVYGEYEFDHEPLYIGKGKGRRFSAINNRNLLCLKVIEELKEQNKEPIYKKVVTNMTNECALVEEIKLIDSIGLENLLNVFPGGGQPPVLKGNSSPHFGKEKSEECKQKISCKLKGRKVKTPKSKETREKLSIASKGRKLSEETRTKISEANIRRGCASEETKVKMSESQKKRWETKDRHFSEKHCKSLSTAQKKKWEDPEYQNKMRIAHLGQIQTEESNKKRSESLKKTWAKRKENKSEAFSNLQQYEK